MMAEHLHHDIYDEVCSDYTDATDERAKPISVLAAGRRATIRARAI
jgi:hypothetical protein